MVFIASYWNEKSSLDLTVFSNCEEVALYLNEKLIGKQKPTLTAFSEKLPHPPFVFKIPAFHKGTLRAEGFLDGKKVSEHVVKSAEKATSIQLRLDESTIKINPEYPDVVFIYASVVDANGTIVSDAVNLIEFSLEGEKAALVGQNPIAAEAGIATIIVRTQDLKKPIKIVAQSSQLKGATLELK
jgi:beta-galactosidase